MNMSNKTRGSALQRRVIAATICSVPLARGSPSATASLETTGVPQAEPLAGTCLHMARFAAASAPGVP
jgi:hypothetical protein